MDATVTIDGKYYKVTHYQFTDTFKVSDSVKSYKLHIVGERKVIDRDNWKTIEKKLSLDFTDQISSNGNFNTYNLIQINIVGDGACQFRALSHQLYGYEEQYNDIRNAIVGYMSSNTEYRDFLNNSSKWGEYINSMRKPDSWGDNQTVKAFSDMTGYTIYIFSYLASTVTKILPTTINGEPPLFLLYNGVHYDSLVPKQSNS